MQIAGIKNNPDVLHFKAKFTAFLKFMISVVVIEYAIRSVYKRAVPLKDLKRKHDLEFAPFMKNDDSSDEEESSNGDTPPNGITIPTPLPHDGSSTRATKRTSKTTSSLVATETHTNYKHTQW